MREYSLRRREWRGVGRSVRELPALHVSREADLTKRSTDCAKRLEPGATSADACMWARDVPALGSPSPRWSDCRNRRDDPGTPTGAGTGRADMEADARGGLCAGGSVSRSGAMCPDE
jgi:hypothetical protein